MNGKAIDGKEVIIWFDAYADRNSTIQKKTN